MSRRRLKRVGSLIQRLELGGPLSTAQGGNQVP